MVKLQIARFARCAEVLFEKCLWSGIETYIVLYVSDAIARKLTQVFCIEQTYSLCTIIRVMVRVFLPWRWITVWLRKALHLDSFCRPCGRPTVSSDRAGPGLADAQRWPRLVVSHCLAPPHDVPSTDFFICDPTLMFVFFLPRWINAFEHAQSFFCLEALWALIFASLTATALPASADVPAENLVKGCNIVSDFVICPLSPLLSCFRPVFFSLLQVYP